MQPVEMRPVLERLLREELARRDLRDFCALMDPHYETPFHTNLLIENLEALERRDIEKLCVFMPPRHSKTYHVSERFPAWYLGRHPDRLVMLASYGADLAENNSRKVRALLTDDRWPFEAAVASDSSAVNRWSTTQGGGLLAAGVGTAATGFGAHLLVIDDPIKDRVEADSELTRDRVWTWYTEVARTRLMPGSVQLLTQTRWHDDDLAGRILNSPQAKDWTVLSLPAIAEDVDELGRLKGEALWPEWFPIESLQEQRDTMGSRAFSALYQQNPIPASGGTFRAEWFKRRGEAPNATYTPNWLICQAIDGAWKTGIANDYSVIATWATDLKAYYLLDVWRGKVEFYDLKRIVVEQHQKHQPHAVYCEEAASGLALLSELRRTTGINIIGIVPKGTKESRVEAVTPMFEAGRVVLPEDAPWLDEWMREHLRFPGAPHDDQVDTTALALIRLRDAAQRSIGRYITPPWFGTFR